jgi:hypothetical protein
MDYIFFFFASDTTNLDARLSRNDKSQEEPELEVSESTIERFIFAISTAIDELGVG